MKKRTLAIITSSAAIAVCASVIAGGTYALFTSSDEVNIAVTSGSVKVKATIDESSILTSTSVPESTALVNPAVYGKNITLNQMAPGDTVTFNINIENTSTISVKYRTRVECLDGFMLMYGLTVNLGEENYSSVKSYASTWQTLPAGNSAVTVSVTLPEHFYFEEEDVINGLQGLAASITYSIDAVQANANLSGSEVEYLSDDYGRMIAMNAVKDEASSFYLVKNEADIYAAMENAKALNQSEYVLCLTENIALTKELLITKLDADLTIEGNGHKIYMANSDFASVSGLCNLIKLDATQSALILKNLTLEHGVVENAPKWYHTLDVNGCSDVTLENVTIVRDFTAVQAGAPLVLNNSNVTASDLTVKAGGNAWYGINVDSSELTLKGNFSYADSEGNKIFRVAALCENNGKIVAAGLSAENYILAGYSFAEGSLVPSYTMGTEVNIYDANGLAALATAVNSGGSFVGVNVNLLADVDLENRLWTPIGTTAALAFKGTFDGNGYTISNLYVANEGNTSAGLFGNVNYGTVKNFNLNNVTITNTSTSSAGASGAVVGNMYPSGYIMNVNVNNVNISAHRWVGGILGGGYGRVTDCTVTGGTITAVPNAAGSSYDNGDKVGGIVGQMNGDSCNVSGCTASDLTITAYRDVGGIAGIFFNGSIPYFKNNTANNLTVKLDNTLAYSEASTNVGVIIGRFEGTAPEDIHESNVAVNCIALYNNGYGVDENGNWNIYTEDGLAAFEREVNGGNAFAGKTVTLMKDIDLEGIDWTPIGTPANPFMGIFDGGNYTVSNLTINAPEAEHVGLFGYISSQLNPSRVYAGIKNLNIENFDITAKAYVGGAVGRIYNRYSSLENINAKNITVNALHYAGGIAGHADGEIYYCTVDNANITLSLELVGENTYDNGDKAGALAGFIGGFHNIEGNVVKNSTVTAYRDLGGLTGNVQGTASDGIQGNNITYLTNNRVENVTLYYISLPEGGVCSDTNKNAEAISGRYSAYTVVNSGNEAINVKLVDVDGTETVLEAQNGIFNEGKN